MTSKYGGGMKKGIIKMYDKLIIAGLMSIIALVGCGTKKKISENTEKNQNKEQVNQTDSINKPQKNDSEQVIAMYGVRPIKLK
ncbi:MAG: hypothetical protein QM751_01615 [Paludibacteraceae bacterium]